MTRLGWRQWSGLSSITLALAIKIHWLHMGDQCFSRSAFDGGYWRTHPLYVSL